MSVPKAFHVLPNVDLKSLPQRFTFPFYYQPHAVAKEATQQLMNYLEIQTDFTYDFGLKRNSKQVGKMFGVLVVEDARTHQIGFLAAFSGKLANSNQHDFFVPPVFDLLDETNFFKAEEAKINSLHDNYQKFLNADEYKEAFIQLERVKEEATSDLKSHKQEEKEAKKQRDIKRKSVANRLGEKERNALEVELAEQSKLLSILYKKKRKYWNYKIDDAQKEVNQMLAKQADFKERLQQRSSSLQQRIFKNYRFLNAKGQIKDALEIFHPHQPPAGTGECAAPKLLQYAFQHDLKPIAMAEFWYGKSLKSQIRKHGEFYPACRSKCEPLLGHMLQGLKVEENPIEHSLLERKKIQLMFEDEHLAVILKPHELLSVPGKRTKFSVLTQLKELYPEATGPLLVHRLDMSTSGIMLMAKSDVVHKQLQAQFIQRKVKKTYQALLAGELVANQGEIKLPLRVDLDNRPHQMVCHQHGKPAHTKWKKIKVEAGKTLVEFYPITGRTHQLRVHAAHPHGLNLPIVGDDLYGKPANRLHLHAASLSFQHPVTKEFMNFEERAEF